MHNSNLATLVLISFLLTPFSYAQEEIQLLSGDPHQEDHFGRSMALWSDQLMIGSGDDWLSFDDPGRVFVFSLKDDGTWVQTAILNSSDGEDDDFFGAKISMYGQRVLITAPLDDVQLWHRAGSAYIFERKQDGNWLEVDKLTTNVFEDFNEFGSNADLHEDRVAINHPSYIMDGYSGGAVYLFEQQEDSSWYNVDILIGDSLSIGAFYGSSVDLEKDRLAVGALQNLINDQHLGSVFVFEYQAGEWVQTARIEGNGVQEFDHFGETLVLEGDRLLIGAPVNKNLSGNGKAYVFDRQANGEWIQSAVLEPPAEDNEMSTSARFGESLILQDSIIYVAAPGIKVDGITGTGKVYKYQEVASGQWEIVDQLFPQTDIDNARFGASLAGSDTNLFVGVPGQDISFEDQGAVYHYGLDPTSTAINPKAEPAPDMQTTIYQNYPNPFYLNTQIQFHLKKSTHVILRVYDILGREVDEIANGLFEAGQHTVSFNARHLPNGSYFYHLDTGEESLIKSMMLVN